MTSFPFESLEPRAFQRLALDALALEFPELRVVPFDLPWGENDGGWDGALRDVDGMEWRIEIKREPRARAVATLKAFAERYPDSPIVFVVAGRLNKRDHDKMHALVSAQLRIYDLAWLGSALRRAPFLAGWYFPEARRGWAEPLALEDPPPPLMPIERESAIALAERLRCGDRVVAYAPPGNRSRAGMVLGHVAWDLLREGRFRTAVRVLELPRTLRDLERDLGADPRRTLLVVDDPERARALVALGPLPTSCLALDREDSAWSIATASPVRGTPLTIEHCWEHTTVLWPRHDPRFTAALADLVALRSRWEAWPEVVEADWLSDELKREVNRREAHVELWKWVYLVSSPLRSIEVLSSLGGLELASVETHLREARELGLVERIDVSSFKQDYWACFSREMAKRVLEGLGENERVRLLARAEAVGLSNHVRDRLDEVLPLETPFEHHHLDGLPGLIEQAIEGSLPEDLGFLGSVRSAGDVMPQVLRALVSGVARGLPLRSRGSGGWSLERLSKDLLRPGHDLDPVVAVEALAQARAGLRGDQGRAWSVVGVAIFAVWFQPAGFRSAPGPWGAVYERCPRERFVQPAIDFLLDLLDGDELWRVSDAHAAFSALGRGMLGDASIPVVNAVLPRWIALSGPPAPFEIRWIARSALLGSAECDEHTPECFERLIEALEITDPEYLAWTASLMQSMPDLVALRSAVDRAERVAALRPVDVERKGPRAVAERVPEGDVPPDAVASLLAALERVPRELAEHGHRAWARADVLVVWAERSPAAFDGVLHPSAWEVHPPAVRGLLIEVLARALPERLAAVIERRPGRPAGFAAELVRFLDRPAELESGLARGWIAALQRLTWSHRSLATLYHLAERAPAGLKVDLFWWLWSRLHAKGAVTVDPRDAAAVMRALLSGEVDRELLQETERSFEQPELAGIFQDPSVQDVLHAVLVKLYGGDSGEKWWSTEGGTSPFMRWLAPRDPTGWWRIRWSHLPDTPSADGAQRLPDDIVRALLDHVPRLASGRLIGGLERSDEVPFGRWYELGTLLRWVLGVAPDVLAERLERTSPGDDERVDLLYLAGLSPERIPCFVDALRARDPSRRETQREAQDILLQWDRVGPVWVVPEPAERLPPPDALRDALRAAAAQEGGAVGRVLGKLADLREGRDDPQLREWISWARGEVVPR